MGQDITFTPEAAATKLAPGVNEIIADFEVEYDTVPPTGLRVAYKKIGFELHWTGNKALVSVPILIDEREQ
jgi:hypothetical protein